MNRRQLEHVLRAASEIADDRNLVVLGSQEILGQFPDPPEALLASVEADLYPRNKPATGLDPEVRSLVEARLDRVAPAP